MPEIEKTTNENLLFVTTDELIDELLARCTHGIIAIMKIKAGVGKETQEDDIFKTYGYTGNYIVCRGLADWVKEIVAEEDRGYVRKTEIEGD